jgi:3-oxoacyl-[acyl-carrier-protein] synthase II
VRRRVAVTGLGFVTPLGTTTDATWRALVAGTSGAAPITRFDPAQLPVRFACEVKGFEPDRYLEKKEIRRYDLFAQFAIGAAAQAVKDSCLEGKLDQIDLKRVGVIIGTGTGGIATFEEQCRIYIEKGPSRVSPFFVPMFMPNVASALVSMRYGLKGPNYCTVSACATSGHALGDAFRLIQHGEADVMVAGGSEAAITPLAIASFANMKALSTRNDDPQTASRPFDKDRDGFVMGEGAGILILEELEHARRRGASILAEIVGYGMSSDAYHMTQPAPEHEGGFRVMRNALRDARLDPGAVGYVNAHGTSTPIGDTLEAHAIRNLFGKKIPVSSTKSMTGHLLGGAGGLEAGVTVLALRDQMLPPTINLENQDPDTDGMDFVPNHARQAQFEYAMSNSFGFGGTNGSLIFKRWTE